MNRVISLICALVLCFSMFSESVICASATEYTESTVVPTVETTQPTQEPTIPAELFPEETIPMETVVAETIPAETAPAETVPTETEAALSIGRNSFTEVPLYYQTDYPDIPYGSGTIATSGCSVTCLAMVASYLTGYAYMPDELANYFVGFESNNHMQKLEHMSDMMQLPWEKAENFHVALQALRDGKIVIAMMNSNSIFTNGQHFIVLTGINEDGKILVNDPNEQNYSHWNLQRAFLVGFNEGDISCGYSGAWIYDPAAMPEEPLTKQRLVSLLNKEPEYDFPQYYQNDYPNIRYGSGSIATSGCSVTSLAMVATYLTGHTYKPDELADYFSAYNSINHIDKLEYMSTQLQLPWSRAQNFHYALEAVQNGKIVIALMEEDSLFTEGQHFIIWTGASENGRIMVADSNVNNYTRWELQNGYRIGFQPDDLLKGYSGGWIYDPAAMPEDPFIYVEEKVQVECRYPGVTLSLSEENLLARMVWVEARGESFEGQQAIAEIVLNRLVSNKFQDSIKGVIYAENQFRSTQFLEDAEPTSIQYEAIERALEGPYVLPLDVYHFATYAVNDNVWGQIGGHIFCYGSE